MSFCKNENSSNSGGVEIADLKKIVFQRFAILLRWVIVNFSKLRNPQLQDLRFLQLTVSQCLPVNLLNAIALQYSSEVNQMVGQVEGQIPASVEKVYTFSLCVPNNTQNQGQP